MNETLTIGCYNTRGLVPALPFIRSELDKLDILAISEHWLYEDALTAVDTVLDTHRGWARADSRLKNRDTESGTWRRGQGGVALLWKEAMNYAVHKLEDGNDRLIGVRVRLRNGQKLIVFAVYFPHATSPIVDFREQLEVMAELFRKYENEGSVIFMGDFNAELGPEGGQRGRGQASRFGSELLTTMEELGLTSLNLNGICEGPVGTFRAFTGKRICESSIDHILVPHSLMPDVIACRVMDDQAMNVSDHNPVVASLLFKPVEWENEELNSNPKPDWKSMSDQTRQQNFKRRVKEKLEERSNPFERSPGSIDREVALITSVLIDTAAEVIPARKGKRHQKPYWSPEVALAHKVQAEAWLQWKEGGRPEERENILLRNYKRSKNNFRNVLRRAKQLQEEKDNDELAELAGTDETAFWRKVQQRRGKKEKPQAVRKGGQLVTDPREVREAWAQHFFALGNEDEDENELFNEEHKALIAAEVEKMTRESYKNNDSILAEPFTVAEVASVCMKLKNGKSAGKDGLTYEHMKYGGEPLWVRLTDLFNMMREEEHIPEVFKRGVKIPLLKQGKTDKTDFDAHRGVTLLPCLAKVWEKVLFERWKPWLQSHGLPHQLQSGGQKGCSNVTTAFIVQEVLSHYNERGSRVYGCFLDTRKAFDTVWLDGMLYKIYKEGTNGRMWRLLKAMHTGNRYTVLLNGRHSREFTTTRGVNQGGVLSLMCYLLATNDVHQELKCGVSIGGLNCRSPALADDICLLASTRRGLQEMIDKMEDYGKTWRFKFAPEKSKCIVFGQNRGVSFTTQPEVGWRMGANNIEEVSHVTHVGVQHESKLQSANAIDSACKKGRGKVGAIAATGLEGRLLNPVTTKKLYNTLVLPSMLHGCEFWNPTTSEMEKLERVHRLGAKRLQGMHFQTETNACLATLGMMPLSAIIHKQKLLLFGRLARLHHTCLAKKVFLFRLYSFVLCKNKQGTRGLIKDCFEIAEQYGLTEYLENYWSTLDFPSKELWKVTVKKAVTEEEERKWVQNVGEHTCCPRLYKTHETNMRPHRLWFVAKKNPQHRENLQRLIHMCTIPVNQTPRSCPTCGNAVSDLIEHFLTICPTFRNTRTDLMDNITDHLGTRVAADIHQQHEERFVEVVLGARVCEEVEPEQWEDFIINAARTLKPLGLMALKHTTWK
ncbi:uncharacterized protein LOC144907947 [Branchiostoma floridae x Branchiostoma belcheri]